MDISIDSLSEIIIWLTDYNVILVNKERVLKNVAFLVVFPFCLVMEDDTAIYMWRSRVEHVCRVVYLWCTVYCCPWHLWRTLPYSAAPIVVQLQIGIFYKRWFWRPSDVLLVFMVFKHV